MSCNKVLIWLDDYRDPRHHGWIERYSPIQKNELKTIHWVKNYEEFVTNITSNGLPDVICFDHDLADEHYAPKERWGDYDTWASEQNFKEKTGYQAAIWLCDYCKENGYELPKWGVQSHNEIGAKKINKLLIDYLNGKY